MQKMLRRSAVLDKLGVSGCTLWRMVRDGNFPAPVMLRPRVPVWAESTVEDWMNSLQPQKKASND